MKINNLAVLLAEACLEAWTEAILETPELQEEITFDEYVEECRIEAESALGI